MDKLKFVLFFLFLFKAFSIGNNKKRLERFQGFY